MLRASSTCPESFHSSSHPLVIHRIACFNLVLGYNLLLDILGTWELFRVKLPKGILLDTVHIAALKDTYKTLNYDFFGPRNYKVTFPKNTQRYEIFFFINLSSLDPRAQLKVTLYDGSDYVNFNTVVFVFQTFR